METLQKPLKKFYEFFGALKHVVFGASKALLSNAQIEDLLALVFVVCKNVVFAVQEIVDFLQHVKNFQFFTAAKLKFC